MIREILRTVADTVRGTATGSADPESEKKMSSDARHAAIEDFLDRRGRLLSMVPLIVILAVASTNMVAAVWVAFSFELFLWLLDGYRSRYHPMVLFPNIIRTALLLSYTLCIVLFYVLKPPLVSNYISCIVISGVLVAMILSMLFMYPFTTQNSSVMVDETTRKSLEFYRFNQVLSMFWICLMGIACGSTWGSLQFPVDSAGQIILGIVLPIVLIIVGFILTPMLARYLKSRASVNRDPSKKDDDDETKGLLERA